MRPWKMEPARDLGVPPIDRLRSLDREVGLISSGMHLAWWSMIRGYLAVWHRLEITGRENLPAKPPYVLIANHASHLDALVLAAPLPWRLRDRIFPIAAGDVFFKTTFVSAFAAGMLNALPMWRKNCGPRALADLRRRLVEEPCIYVLFPEGARSRDGALLKFKAGLGMLVGGTEVPVVPCRLTGCFEALPAKRRLPLPTKIRLTIGTPVTFANVPPGREGWNQVAETCEEKVRLLDKPRG
jgi:1-acyl-sn-glycerol-3-phosphate acyltransferase